MNIDPREAFSDLSPNVMTPDPRIYALLVHQDGAPMAVELSEGEGFDHQPLYGVTARLLCPVHGWESLHGLSRLFYDEGEAQGYIVAMGEVVAITTPSHEIRVEVAS